MKSRHAETWHERLRSPLTWHILAVSTLAVLALALSIRVAAWHSFRSLREKGLAERRARLAVLQAELLPLRGTSKEIAQTSREIDGFYQSRIATSYSRVTGSIGDIAIRSGVRLTRIEYSQGEPGSDLTQVSMEVGVDGDYPHVMQFVNGLERDEVFFVIRTLSFASMQGGIVGLRVKLSTWLRSRNSTRGPSAVDESVRTVAQLDRR
jgi:hypothetical protein